MASEITVNLSGTISRGTAPYNITGEIFPSGSVSFDSSTTLRDCIIKSIATSDTSLTALLPNTDNAEGLLYIKNLDQTNYVTFGPDSGGSIVPMVRLNPGKVALIPLYPTVTLRAQANTGACICDIRLYAGNSTSGA